MERNIGLVLSGGGGKGAYEIGVWRALDEFGVTPNIGGVAGTSVGALNAALFSQGSCEEAVRIWSSISPAAILTINLKKITATITQAMGDLSEIISQKPIIDWARRLCENQGVFSKDGLSALIEREINPDYIQAFDGPVFATVFNLSHMKAEYHDLRDGLSPISIRDRLLASASIPVVFGETYVDGALCWDGGLPVVGDNTPVKPLYEVGFRTIIVVHLSREVPVDQSKFPDCRIIEIMPQESLGGAISGTLNFEAQRAKENILRGYQDAVRVLEPIYRMGKSLNRIESAMVRIGRNSVATKEVIREIDVKIATDTAEIEKIMKELNERGIH